MSLFAGTCGEIIGTQIEPKMKHYKTGEGSYSDYKKADDSYNPPETLIGRGINMLQTTNYNDKLHLKHKQTFDKTTNLITKHIDFFKLIVQKLLEKKILFHHDLTEIIREMIGRNNEFKTEYQEILHFHENY